MTLHAQVTLLEGGRVVGSCPIDAHARQLSL